MSMATADPVPYCPPGGGSVDAVAPARVKRPERMFAVRIMIEKFATRIKSFNDKQETEV